MQLKLLLNLDPQMGLALIGIEGQEFVSLPPGVLSVNHVYTAIGASSIVPGNIFNIKYQIFLNDILLR